jgi:hypothetical protein
VPAETTDTKQLPAVPDAQVTSYALRRDRSVVEVCLRPLGVRIGRVRLPARNGDLLVTGTPPVASIRVELPARPDRAGPLIGILLRRVPRRGRLTFAATDVDLPTGSHTAPVDGDLDGAGSAPWSLPLTARTVAWDDTAIVLTAHGPARPPASARGWPARAGRWLWVEAAVEFTR